MKKKLVLAKETLWALGAREVGQIAAGASNLVQCRTTTDDTRSVYWSCVCTPSGMYTCAC
jgi:hypothetical protein